MFSFLFLNNTCEKPNLITLHNEKTENDVADFKWILKVEKLHSNYIEFEIIKSKEINNGLYDVLNEFEKGVDYADFIQIKAGKKLCRLKSNSISEFETGNLYYTKVYSDETEIFFSRSNFYNIRDFVNQESTINSKISALSSTGWAIEKQLKFTYKTLLREVEITDFLMNNNESYEELILLEIKSEFRSIVGRTKKEDIDVNKLQNELKKKLETKLTGIDIIEIELKD